LGLGVASRSHGSQPASGSIDDTQRGSKPTSPAIVPSSAGGAIRNGIALDLACMLRPESALVAPAGTHDELILARNPTIPAANPTRNHPLPG